MPVLSKLQRGLESLYRLHPEQPVHQFLISADARDAAGVTRSPREQLLVSEDEDGMSIGLFFDPDVIDSVTGWPIDLLMAGSGLGDFLMLVEGVSHFVYLAFRATSNQSLSALELELQAEVDKYVTCLLSSEQTHERSTYLRRRLFQDISFDEDLDADEKDRYRVANSNALRYSQSLERRYVRQHRIGEMLVELRQFYRMNLQNKMHFIRQAA